MPARTKSLLQNSGRDSKIANVVRRSEIQNFRLGSFFKCLKGMLMDSKEIKKIRESDIKRYVAMWDKIKKPKLKNNDYLFSPYSGDKAALIRDYIALSKISKSYKTYFLAMALEIAFEEAEVSIGESLQDLAHNLRMLTRSRIITAEQKLAEALFMRGLVRHGASANSSFRSFAKWRKLSVSNCRTAYHEIQRLIKSHPAPFDQSLAWCGWLANSKKPFPPDNSKTYQAFEKLCAEIKST